ncbi:hypothetical protein BKN38_07855 [Helicobacter sp. CLO-3]|nr:hypothetical protein BA723_08045 [Helicobacter sp. CLO-3]OHU82057.1 hypothetical protein BKN38_07855 [Helicobacter sp. CLO-3]
MQDRKKVPKVNNFCKLFFRKFTKFAPVLRSSKVTIWQIKLCKIVKKSKRKPNGFCLEVAIVFLAIRQNTLTISFVDKCFAFLNKKGAYAKKERSE